ncbi:hypothetical protein PPYR_06953 [Photinus pyralis]|uniref:Structural maintenance of chromosomes protein n=2 Tax=Photinus pyralis TaxID=7054 RepID=A0A5N4AP60_PHOPY|nr:structural maintenance of chromosomes protein 4 [Photinus pyralis]KAB0799073.1 hypothetical protein PPYR_06953 [Photinus pyralis]
MSPRKPEKKTQKRKLPAEDEESEASEHEDLSDEEGGLRVDGIYIPPPPISARTLGSDGPRLIITAISNYFFKSYAETQVLGPFHKCFNAIVGPNGSGKSNVIDAMLFVFGYRATKIRCKKISVLLHNSEHYSNIQTCTVAVRFAEIVDKPGDEYEIVQGSEFEIARTANKDNSSYYTVNGSRVQFKEVAKKLRSYGIDLDHNRFLILQGEVEQIAMMKSKGQSEHETGMLEYLEDIIGTSRYKVPLVKLEERVELLADQRSEKLNRVKLVEKELEELKKPMEDAVEFLELENSIVLSKNIIFQWHICEAEEKIKQIEEEKSEVAAAQNELAEKLAKTHQEKQEGEHNFKEACKKCENLRKRTEKLKEAFGVANNRDIQLQAEMTQTNKTRKKTKELLAEEQKKLVEYERMPKENEDTIQECMVKEAEMTAKKEKLQAEKVKLLASLREATVELQEQKEHLQTELVDLKKEVDETKSAFSLAESELNIFVSTEANEKKKLEHIQNVYANIKENINSRSREIADLKKRIPANKEKLTEARNNLKEAKAQEAEFIDQIRTRRTSLAEVKSSMQATRSRGRVLDSLMKEKREGRCPGLFGRLGDLGAINQKYDVAISTACGPLDNIVVDTVTTAQWCIEFLKRNDVGRATFIALEKQEHLRGRAESSIVTPENVPRLFDLVKIADDRIKPAFYYALRDTLVANDLDQASRIAYGKQRYRVVTLTGQLIETTGTMSGGGKTVSRGRMGQSVAVSTTDPKDVQRMEETLQNMEERIRILRQEQENCEAIINTLEPEVKQMETDVHKFTIELESSKQQEPLIAEQLETQKAKSKSTKADTGTVKKLTQIVNQKKQLYDRATEAANEIQVQVDRLTHEIKEKTVGKMKAMDKNLKDVQNTIDKCKSEITRRNVATKTAQRNFKKSTEKIATMEQDIVDMENKLRSMKAQREEIERDAKELLQSIENITTELGDAEEQCADLKKAVSDLAKEENKIKSDKIEVDQKCKTYNAQINEHKGQIHGYRSKLAHLKLQEIPDQATEELKEFTQDELKEKNIGNIQRQLTFQENQIKSAKPNLNAITEYRKKQMIFIERSKELDELSQKKAKVKEALDNVRQKRKEEFATGYNIIRLKLKEMYQMITLGGDADFEYVDTFDPFTEGIQFNVRPPKKSWKNISNLSGGEKTLSSLALVFALHYYKPSPLYVMDEIDAALDFKNVSIVANYIKERTKNAQFVIISLRSNMFELSDHLIGIYKTFNCTKSITINPRVYDKPKQTAMIPEPQQNGNDDIIETPQGVASEDKEVENEPNEIEINGSQMEVDE